MRASPTRSANSAQKRTKAALLHPYRRERLPASSKRALRPSASTDAVGKFTNVATFEKEEIAVEEYLILAKWHGVTGLNDQT